MTISQRAQDVRARLKEGKVGERVFANVLDLILTRTNKDPQAVQISAITVASATNGKTYTVTINGVDVSYTADATATTSEIAAGLADAINANPYVRGQVKASASGAVCTVTGLWPGVSFTLTESDAELSVATSQSADEADEIPFGVLVVDDGSDSDDLLCKLAKSSGFTAQVSTVDYTYTAGKILSVEVRDAHSGRSYQAQTVQATDKATSTAALVAALNGVLPANFVTASAGTGDEVALTADLAGLEFGVSVGADDATVAPTVTDTTGPSPSTSILRAAVGVSLYAYDEAVASVEGTEAGYPANAGVKVLAQGQIWVENDESVSAGDPVYVEMSGADAGKFFKTDSSTRLRLPACKWVRAGYTSTDAIAALDFRL